MNVYVMLSVNIFNDRLARQLQKEVQSSNSQDFTEDQKVLFILCIVTYECILLYLICNICIVNPVKHFFFIRKPWGKLQPVWKCEVLPYRLVHKARGAGVC